MFNLCQESTTIVVPNIKHKKKYVWSPKIKFSDELTTTNSYLEIDNHKNDTELIESTAHQNNQSKLNSRATYSIFQDRSSMNLKEDNQGMDKINTIHKTVYLNESNENSMYPFLQQ